MILVMNPYCPLNHLEQTNTSMLTNRGQLGIPYLFQNRNHPAEFLSMSFAAHSIKIHHYKFQPSGRTCPSTFRCPKIMDRRKTSPVYLEGPLRLRTYKDRESTQQNGQNYESIATDKLYPEEQDEKQ